MFLSIGQAAEVIGVSVGTLRRWELEGKFSPCFRTYGHHRRYSLNRIKAEIFKESSSAYSKETKPTYCYARVSSHEQKLDLKRQEKRLAHYCEQNKWRYKMISDLGSGLNYQKKGLNKLINLICSSQISRLVLTHKDRLLRFGSPLLFKLCKYFGVEVIIIDKQLANSFEKELVADVIEIMSVFTAKMHGRRSHLNRKACAQG